MNKSIVTGMVLGILLMIVFTIIYIYYLITISKKKNRIRLIGIKAEKQINYELKKWAKNNNAVFINTSLYRYDNNKVFEVDGILLTKGGIIVVEIKSIKGTIIGNANENKWTKKLKYNSFDITNPIIQNDRHIRHIMEIIKEKVPIVSLIVFSNRTENIKVTNIPQYALVIRQSTLFKNLDKIKEVLQPTISNKDFRIIKKNILKYRTHSKYAKNLHKKITGRID